MYFPAIGRFTTEDAKGFAAGDTNLFRYVYNSPTNATDPSGNDILAIGSGTTDEVLWQLQNTFNVPRGEILVDNLGAGGNGIWENPTGNQEVYFIRRSLQSSGGRRPFGPQSDIPAINTLYSAYMSRSQLHVVAQLDQNNAKDPSGNALPGLWHQFDPNRNLQLYIGTPLSDLSILTQHQQEIAIASMFSEMTGNVSRVSPERLKSMVQDGLAQEIDGYIYVAWVDIVTQKQYQILYEPFRRPFDDPDHPDYQYKGLGNERRCISVRGREPKPFDMYKAVGFAETPLDGKDPAAQLKNITSSQSARNMAASRDARREGRQLDANLTWAQAGLETLQVTARITPILGTTIDAIEGKTTEAILSGIGDASLLVGFGAIDKLRKAGRLSRGWTLSVGASTALQVSAAGYNVRQGIRDLLSDNYWKSAAHFGEAGLRLLGATPALMAWMKARTASRVAALEAELIARGQPLGRGSTGRTTPNDVYEALAIQQAMQNPSAGRVLDLPMTDPRWLAADGWVKMARNVFGKEVHYVWNRITGAVDDFKLK